jgi:hypothetical protein
VASSDIFYWLYSPLGPWSPIFSFMIILQTVGLFRRVISSSQGLYLNTEQHKHKINTYTYQTFMPCVGFEPTIPASERAKTVHALDRSATVTGHLVLESFVIWRNKLAAVITLLTCVREVSGSNLDRHTDSPDWGCSWYSSVPSSITCNYAIFSPVHHSVTFVPVDAIHCDMTPESRNSGARVDVHC